MVARLITTITKKPEDDWRGKYFDNAKSVSSPPDARDSQCTLTEEVKNLYINAHLNHTKSADGYLGWDRFYIDDNNIEYIVYFDTRVNAELYLSNVISIAESTFRPHTEALEVDKIIPIYTLTRRIDTIDALPTRT